MLRNLTTNIISFFFRFLPIKRNQILFISYYGAQYGCNPKYISEYLIKNHKDHISIVWALTNIKNGKPSNVKIVKYGSIKYLKALSTSRIICTNYRMTMDFKKRNSQTYIQTWHSSLRLKKIERDASDTLSKDYIRMAKHDSAQTDYVIAGCGNSRNTFETSFWYSGRILEYGTPRNDLLIHSPQGKINSIKDLLNIPIEKKIILYAPTFRKDKSLKPYQLDFNNVCKLLSNRFGGEWIVLLRLHPHLINEHLFCGIDNMLDVTNFNDIQELLLISDILVTDYSSLMFDFAISYKPVFLFATDIAEYSKHDRSFYFDIQRLPFPLANDNSELAENILSFDEDKYKSNLKYFYNSVGSFENGNASEKVSNLIMNLIKS